MSEPSEAPVPVAPYVNSIDLTAENAAPSPESIESTGFSAENINSVLTAPASAGRPAAERAIFTMARTCVRLTAVRVGVIEGELDRHLLCLHKGILIRTTEQQAALSIADIDKAIAELQKARDALDGSSDAEPQQEDVTDTEDVEGDLRGGGLTLCDIVGFYLLLKMGVKGERWDQEEDAGG